MASGQKKASRNDKLRSALRDNLKKRKAQARKINAEADHKSVSLRDRDVVAHKNEGEPS